MSGKTFKNNFFSLAIICLLVFSLYPNFNACAETPLKTSVITNFSINELKEFSSVEITAQAANCLNNAKMAARIKNKKKGIIKKIFTQNVVIDDTIELQRIYYDPETFDAVFSGIIPYNLKDVDINLEISNFSTADALERTEEKTITTAPVEKTIVVQEPEKKIIVPIIRKQQSTEDPELLKKMEEEKRSNDANEELGKAMVYSAQKKQEAAKVQEQNDYEVVVGVVVLLPLLLEFAAGGIEQENNFEIETEPLAESETEPESETESEAGSEDEETEDEKKRNKRKKT